MLSDYAFVINIYICNAFDTTNWLHQELILISSSFYSIFIYLFFLILF